MVVTGIEPATGGLLDHCSTKLSYTTRKGAKGELNPRPLLP